MTNEENMELQSYKDKTPITGDFLLQNGFEKREYYFLYCDGCVEICAQCTDKEVGIWRVEVSYLDYYDPPQALDICTIGQFRMFLTICGVGEEFVKSFKKEEK